MKTLLLLAATLLLVALSVLCHMTVPSAGLNFMAACLAIIPLAGWMGRVTEEIAVKVGPRLGGLLSATFGNAVEIIIGCFALSQGLTTLVKASITGSILGNLLFVLGLSFLVGGLKHPVQRFNIRVAHSQTAMLMLGIPIMFLLPVIFSVSRYHSLLVMTGAVCSVSFLVYILGLVFSLYTHRQLLGDLEEERNEDIEDPGRIKNSNLLFVNLPVSLLILLIVTVLVGVESDFLVHSVEHLASHAGWSQMFLGVIVVAIIGNAAEHASAVWMAWKNRMDLSLEIAVGSSLQVAMFVAPVLYFFSIIVGHPMFFQFSVPELVSLTAAILLVAILMVDGESNWLEGAMAVGAYAVMAIGFYILH
ncbi:MULTISPECIES: calcium/proton exchanger [Alicyclobacillus]|uniref:Ca(2+)/H(+) antiporter n=1 Tax=Alicyclobacillus tolerans TaxID=90970 RepID=A0ABT9LVL1_9BACL|nr:MULTISPECIES: calcium/proton exchanger [Alicyclobacillus]MDP9728226.1 Ca2+:H+ antiporter [Alicyclobacillus tengchongensis]